MNTGAVNTETVNTETVSAETPATGQAPATPVANRMVATVLVVSTLVILVVALGIAIVSGAHGWVDGESSGAWPYVVIFISVVGDAIIPIFPSESILNTASVLASTEDNLKIGWIIVAGALGAVVGDSLLYWIARLDLVRLGPRVESARKNPKVAQGLDLLGERWTVLILFGRYLPGVRFVVNAMAGLLGVPYPRFLRLSAIAGATWSAYTCLLAYWVGSALNDFPLASIIISGAVTTALIAVLYWFEFRRRRSRHKTVADDLGTAAGAGAEAPPGH